jgi:hypothetical protein
MKNSVQMSDSYTAAPCSQPYQRGHEKADHSKDDILKTLGGDYDEKRKA